MRTADFFNALVEIVGEESAKRYAQKFGPLNEKLTGEIYNYEALAIYTYSTELMWYERINSELWSSNPSEEILIIKYVLNGLLAKLTPYTLNRSVVYRGYRSSDLDRFLNRYQIAGTVHFPAFTSATFKRELAFGGNVFFTIKTLTGKAIWHLAAKYDEFEVLIPAGRDFAVLEVERRGNRAFIALEELNESQDSN